MESCVLGCDTLPMTGTRPSTSSTTVSMLTTRSLSDSAANSPVVPDTHMPCAPLSMR